MNEIKDEFTNISEVYNKENSNAYTLAHRTYEAAVKDAYENATEIVDPETEEITYEGLNLPTFEFIPRNIFDADFLNINLSERALSMFDKHYKNKVDSFEEIQKDLSLRLTTKINKLFNLEIKRSEILLFNGSKIEVSYMPSTPKIISREIENLYETDKNSLFLTLFHPNSKEVFNDMVISIDSGEKLYGKLIQEDKNLLTYKFKSNSGTFSNTEETILTGNFKNSNNESFAFGKSGIVENENEFYCIVGTSIRCYVDRRTGQWYSFDEGGLPVSPDPDLVKPCSVSLYDGEPGTTSPIYGIKKIGIAEFKRVEQELCCYVEGEVSHIENILAREYKEKSTKSLTRSETITEKSEERESENLTDTTSTDRYELQQEVGKVLEKSKELSYGASVNANARYGKEDGP